MRVVFHRRKSRLQVAKNRMRLQAGEIAWMRLRVCDQERICLDYLLCHYIGFQFFQVFCKSKNYFLISTSYQFVLEEKSVGSLCFSQITYANLRERPIEGPKQCPLHSKRAGKRDLERSLNYSGAHLQLTPSKGGSRRREKSSC